MQGLFIGNKKQDELSAFELIVIFVFCSFFPFFLFVSLLPEMLAVYGSGFGGVGFGGVGFFLKMVRTDQVLL